MKVIIISLPRTGSTTLMKALGTVFNLETVNEPYYDKNPEAQVYPIKQKNYFIEKSHINHKPSNIDKSSFDFFCDYYKEFDNVILLGRNDLDAMTESFIQGRNTNNFHDPYSIPKGKKFKNFNKYRERAEHWMNTVEKFSQTNNIPITWYEDLYSGEKSIINKVIKDWGLDIDLDLFYSFIDPKYKYRRESSIV